MSTARIQQLSPRLANQIAAGEVVERPASVVKELLENSLDAGSTRIEIEIERGGVQLIRISDNGAGIHPDDLPLALARHATSKIATIDDLAAVLSLGFRGEALASIASVAKLLLISRRRGETTAWQAFAEGAGMQVQVQPAALNEGTRIEVRDLFFNTPARRRFLRSEATEFAHIDDIVRRVALARPDVAITLKHNGRGVRQLRADRDEASHSARVAAVLGRSFLVTAVPVNAQIDSLRLRGFVGHPDQHRAQADGQYVFVNGRAIRDRVVTHAIRAGFSDRIPAGRSPCYALFLELPATEVDVNVHPTKHEVRFRNARWLHDWLTRTVSDAVAQTAEQINFATGEVMPVPSSAFATATVQEVRGRYERISPTYSSPVTAVTPPAVREAPPVIDIADSRMMPMGSGAAISVQRVSPQHLLQWAAPPRLWQTQSLLTVYLNAVWFALPSVPSLPLLLPVSIPHLDVATQTALQAHGFVFRGEQLLAAPAVLRGAEWPQLCAAFADAEPMQWPCCAAQHLLQQPNSQSAAFWQTVLEWADQQGAAAMASHGKVLSASDWQMLWPV